MAEGPYNNGFVWFLKPASWNKNFAGILTGRAMADSTGNSAPSGNLYAVVFGMRQSVVLFCLSHCVRLPDAEQSFLVPAR